MITIDRLPEHEIKLTAIRAGGPGGQHVNKVSSAIHLRFDVRASSLPAAIKHRLLRSGDTRVNAEGVIVIKARRFRSREQNRAEALARLDEMLQAAQRVRKRRRATRPSLASVQRRLATKRRQGELKKMRRKAARVTDWR